MQLHLGTDELDLIANILLEHQGHATSEGESSPSLPRGSQETCEDLLEKVLARNTELDAEELQQLADILADQRGVLKQRICVEPYAPTKSELLKTLAKLERVLEKVDEACVMF